MTDVLRNHWRPKIGVNPNPHAPMGKIIGKKMKTIPGQPYVLPSPDEKLYLKLADALPRLLHEHTELLSNGQFSKNQTACPVIRLLNESHASLQDTAPNAGKIKRRNQKIKHNFVGYLSFVWAWNSPYTVSECPEKWYKPPANAEEQDIDHNATSFGEDSEVSQIIREKPKLGQYILLKRTVEYNKDKTIKFVNALCQHHAPWLLANGYFKTSNKTKTTTPIAYWRQLYRDNVRRLYKHGIKADWTEAPIVNGVRVYTNVVLFNEAFPMVPQILPLVALWPRKKRRRFMTMINKGNAVRKIWELAHYFDVVNEYPMKVCGKGGKPQFVVQDYTDKQIDEMKENNRKVRSKYAKDCKARRKAAIASLPTRQLPHESAGADEDGGEEADVVS